MSGVFLVVKDKNGVLHEVAGDPPHVTVFYSGDAVPENELVEVGVQWLTQARSKDNDLVLDRAQLSSFTQADGTMRHDVLLLVENTDAITRFRAHALACLNAPVEKFFMMAPHVTAAACATREEAERRLAELEPLLPLEVRIVGVMF